MQDLNVFIIGYWITEKKHVPSACKYQRMERIVLQNVVAKDNFAWIVWINGKQIILHVLIVGNFYFKNWVKAHLDYKAVIISRKFLRGKFSSILLFSRRLFRRIIPEHP
jgi:hypothetical protein